jgi:hypothetical protein
MIKINIKVKNTPKLDGFKKELLNKQFLSELARNIQQIIKKRVKSGKGVSDDTTDPKETKIKKLAELSPKYINKRTINVSILGEFAKPARSNLTYTGQMLNAIIWKVSDRKIILTINDNIRKDKEMLTNSQVAQYASKSRPFFNLADSEMRIVLFQIKQHINALTKKYFG